MEYVQAFDSEEVREFFVRRNWLAGDDALISKDAYQSLKNRDGEFWESLGDEASSYLFGFIAGWKARDK